MLIGVSVQCLVTVVSVALLHNYRVLHMYMYVGVRTFVRPDAKRTCMYVFHDTLHASKPSLPYKLLLMYVANNY